MDYINFILHNVYSLLKCLAHIWLTVLQWSNTELLYGKKNGIYQPARISPFYHMDDLDALFQGIKICVDSKDGG